MVVLDTHAFIWAHKGIRIGKRTERRIAAAANEHELFVSAITPWEIALGVRRGRIRVSGALATADTAILEHAPRTKAVRVIEI